MYENDDNNNDLNGMKSDDFDTLFTLMISVTIVCINNEDYVN